MADDVKAAPVPATGKLAAAEKEISWIGARMREPSTYAGLGAVAAAAGMFGLIPTTDANELVKYLTTAGMAIGGIIGVVLPEAAKAIGKLSNAASAVLLACVFAAALLHVDPASAQSARIGLPIRLAPLAPAAAAVPATPATSSDPLANFMAQLEKVTQENVAAVIADIQLADADAGTIITPAIAATPAVPANPNATPPTPAVPAFPGAPADVKDPIAHACYPAAVQFLQSIPAVAAPTGKFIGVQLFQAKRDFIAQLQAGLPTYLKLGCAPLLGDEINIAVQVFNMIGIKVVPAALTALMPALAPITLPAMTLVP